MNTFPKIEEIRAKSEDVFQRLIQQISAQIINAANEGERGVRINYTALEQRAISAELLVQQLKTDGYSAWLECPYRDTYICITW